MGAGEIRVYLSHLATDKNVAASTRNVALSALLFLYRQVLRMSRLRRYETDRTGKQLTTKLSRRGRR